MSRPLSKALVIAISYLGTNAELRGCVNDGERVYGYLKRCAPQCEIRVLCDDRRMRAPIFAAPTHAEILRQIDWLVAGATAESHVWISYSGHGGSQRVLNRALEAARTLFKPLETLLLREKAAARFGAFPVDDEETIVMSKENSPAAQAAHAANTRPLEMRTPGTSQARDTSPRRLMKIAKKKTPGTVAAPAPEPAEIDGQNETILPSDFGYAGEILDDVLRRRLVDALPAGARLTAFFDSCHSGTVLDLRYNWLDTNARSPTPSIEKTEHRSLAESKAQVLMLSGCRDAQTSADAYLDGEFCGATSKAFLACLDVLERQTNGAAAATSAKATTRAFGDKLLTDNNLDTLEEFLHAMNVWMADNNFSQRPQISLGRNENVREAVETFFPILRQ